MTKKKVKPSLLSAEAIAIALFGTRQAKKEIEKEEKALTAELKEAMKREQVKEAGSFQISVARTLKVKDEKVAYLWAKENNCVVPEKIDTSKAKEVLRHTFDSPEKYGFAVVESERIVPKGEKLEDNEN